MVIGVLLACSAGSAAVQRLGRAAAGAERLVERCDRFLLGDLQQQRHGV